MTDPLSCFEICAQLHCDACDFARWDHTGKRLETVFLGWDCSAVREYVACFGRVPVDFDSEIYPILSHLLFPRRPVAEQLTLEDADATPPTYAEAMAAAHDRMVANYDENAERAKARAAR